MTKAELKQYRSLKKEIEDIEHQIQSSIAHGVVKSAVNFPYQNRPVVVCGVESSRQDNICRLKSKMLDVKQRCDKIIQFIDNIQDSETQRIFRLYYIEGHKKSWQSVAYRIGGNDEQYPRRKHNNYLNNIKFDENDEFSMV